MNPVSKLESIRDGVTDALRNAPEFAALSTMDGLGGVVVEAGIPQSIFIAKAKGDLATALSMALNKCGLSVVISVLGGRDDGSQSIQCYLDKVRIVISISELVTVNQDSTLGGTGLGGMYIAEKIVATLKELDLGIEGVSLLVPDDSRETIEDATDASDLAGGYYCLNVYFKTRALLDPRATS